MILDKRQLKYLRQLSHSLQAVVMIGKDGLSPSVIEETRTSLLAHELIKIKFQSNKTEKTKLSTSLAETTESNLVTIVGNYLILYKQHKDPAKRKIKL